MPLGGEYNDAASALKNISYRSFQPTLTDTGLKRFGLELEHSPACSLLAADIHSFLQIRTSKPGPYPVIPDGTQAIFISPTGSLIGGAQSQACDLHLPCAGSYFGIRFYPGALRHFFDLSLDEISNQFVDHQYFPCRRFAELHEKIYRCDSFRDRAKVCERWLLTHLKPQAATSFDRALALTYQSMGTIKVGSLAASVGWSGRHLNRLFRQHTGLDAKTFAQTVRIQAVCERLHKSPGSSLEIALELGFFDQSHLANDFRSRLLMTASAFRDRFRSDFYNQ